ncbi:MAG: hypothetical protein HY735_28630 [Verrucomicrobia bacterium]|nr:hypothetical protein [Verrucomicrobiota bacterium]
MNSTEFDGGEAQAGQPTLNVGQDYNEFSNGWCPWPTVVGPFFDKFWLTGVFL